MKINSSKSVLHYIINGIWTTFAIFSNDCQKVSPFEKLNNMHVNLKFTIENAVDSKLAFLDVLVHREKQHFYTSIYRKTTFTRDYIPFDYFSLIKKKILLVASHIEP